MKNTPSQHILRMATPPDHSQLQSATGSHALKTSESDSRRGDQSTFLKVTCDVFYCLQGNIFPIVSLLTLLAANACSAAQKEESTAPEFGVITAEHGYVVDADDKILETLATFSVVDIEQSGDPWLFVSTAAGSKGWIRIEQLHRSSLFPDITAENAGAIRQSLAQVEHAVALSQKGDYAAAIDPMKRALQTFETQLGTNNTGYAWLLACLSGLQLNQGDGDASAATLKRAEEILTSVNSLESLHAADLFNARAILAQSQGNPDDAIRDYQTALRITRSHLSANHSDIRIVSSNLAMAYDQTQQPKLAIPHQQDAKVIGEIILPADVVERVNDCRNLATYQFKSGEYKQARDALLEAKVMLDADDSPPLTLTADVMLDLSECYYQNQDPAMARRRLNEVVDVLADSTIADTESAGEFSRIHTRMYKLMGLVESSVARYEVALEHYESSLSFVDQDSPDIAAAETAKDAGNMAAKLERYSDARRLYQLSLSMYQTLEAKDSDAAVQVRTLLAELPKRDETPMPQDGSTDAAHVLVTATHGYLTDDSGKLIRTIPPLSYLEVVGETETSFRVRDQKSVLFIRKELVRSGAMLPSHGVMSELEAQPIYQQLERARALMDNHELAAAHGAFIEAIDNLSRATNDSNPFYVTVSCMISVCAANQGNLTFAEHILDKQADYLKQLDQEQHPAVIDVLVTLSYLRYLNDQLDESAQFMRKVQGLQSMHGLDNSAESIIPQQLLVVTVLKQGDFRAALEQQNAVMNLVTRIYPPTSIEFADSLAFLGAITAMNDGVDEGMDLLNEAVKIAERSPNAGTKPLSIRQSYGLFLKFTGRTSEAETLLTGVVHGIAVKDSFPNLTSKLTVLTELADIHYATGNFESVIPLAEEGLTLVKTARGFTGVSIEVTAASAERLHQMLIDSCQKLGDSAKAKLHTDALAQLNRDRIAAKETNGSEKNSAMSDQPVPQDQNGAAVTPDAGSGDRFNLLPPHEAMLVTTQVSSVLEAPNGKPIASLKKDARVWALEQVGGHFRVKVPGKDQYGWVNQQHAADLNALLTQSLMQKVLQDAADRQLDPEAIGTRATAVMALFNEARQLNENRDYEKAVQQFEAALQGSRDLMGEDNPLSAMVSTELASAYVNAKQFSRARKMLDDVQPVTRSTLGDNHPRVAVDAWRMGTLLNLLGDLNGAVKQLQTAVRVAEDAYGREDIRSGMLRAELAQILTQQGLLDQAETILKEIITALGSDRSKPNPLRASVIASLGTIEFRRDRLEASLELFEQAHDEYTSLGDNFRGARGRTLLSAGIATARSGELAEAADLLSQAAEDLTAAGGNNAEVRGQIAEIEAMMAFFTGDLRRSETLMTKAVEAVSEVYGQDHIATSFPTTQLASILASQNKIGPAIKQFDAARRSVLTYINQTLADLPVRDQTAFLRIQDKRELDRALSISLRDTAGSAEHDMTAKWLLNARNLPHELSARGSQIRRLLRKSADAETYDRYRTARERLATMPTGTSDAAELTFRKEEVHQLQQQMQSALQKLPAEVQQQMERQTSTFVDIDSVRKSLQNDETLVEITRMRPLSFLPADVLKQNIAVFRPAEEYVAWIIPPLNGDANPFDTQQDKIQVVRLGNAERIDELVSQVLREMLQSFKTIGTEGHAKATQSALAASQPLADTVWKPIQNALNGRTKVILSPDGELWRAPWSALPIGNERMLVEDFELRLVVSGRELVRRNSNTLALSAPLILADPDYDATASDLRDALKQLTLGIARPTRDSTNGATDQVRSVLSSHVVRLPGTAIEARAVLPNVKQLASQEPTMCLQAQASEEVFRRCERPYSVMFSTHGFFLPHEKLPDAAQGSTLLLSSGGNGLMAASATASDPLLRCGLLLAGCNRNEQSDAISDGILLGREIVETDLRGTKLVVLSACETGVGDVADGQGIAGLRQAFQLAGAESVVSTLWSIDDRETSRLMTEFFSQLSSGKNKPAALRQAQLSRIEALRNRNGAAHPFFWAAFTVTGEK